MHHIMSYFTSLNILNLLQHGFRPNHSCQTQLVDFIDEIQRSMNARQQSHLLFDYDYDYDYDLIQGKGNACKPAQYIVTLLLYS